HTRFSRDWSSDVCSSDLEEARTNRGVHDGAGTLDDVAFLDGTVIAEDHDTDIVGFEVERHALDAARELDELTGLHLVEAVNAGRSEERRVGKGRRCGWAA